MRLTENKLRSIIRKVITEAYEDLFTASQSRNKRKQKKAGYRNYDFPGKQEVLGQIENTLSDIEGIEVSTSLSDTSSWFDGMNNTINSDMLIDLIGAELDGYFPVANLYNTTDGTESFIYLEVGARSQGWRALGSAGNRIFKIVSFDTRPLSLRSVSQELKGLSTLKNAI